jgi:hypothetical protein
LTKIRRGGYVFMTWIGDHPPPHVHVYRDGRLVMKWDLKEGCVVFGAADRRIVLTIRALQKEGRL